MIIVRRLQRGRLWAALLLGLLSGAVQAHGVRDDVRVDMAALNIEGLVVEVHQDYFSPQLAVSNRTGKLLEILDADGRAFLRLGPAGAEGDIAAKAYHLSRVAGGGDARANTLSATPRWRLVSKEPAYGWFDARLTTTTLEIPYAVKQIGKEMPFADWRIPARLGGKPIEMRGVFTYTPPTAGVAMAVLRTQQPAPGVIVQLVPGPVPAVFLLNNSANTVQVLDGAGKAFLKISRKGVWADTGSKSWRAASPSAVGTETGWKQISNSNSSTWLEPRAAWTGKLPQPMPASRQLNSWSVPLLIGEERRELTGINQWVLAAVPKPARP